jgi:class 3 adenylate cyclase
LVPSHYSLDAQVLDLEAVVDRLDLDRFALLAIIDGGPAAITYAARHAERVSHLALWCSWARYSDLRRSPAIEALDTLMVKDWEIYLQTITHVSLGWSEGEHARRYARLIEETVTPQAMQAFRGEIGRTDTTKLLRQIKSPTLVFHRRQAPFPGLDVATGLASSIPNARLAVLEGDSLAPWVGDMELVATAIDEFLGESEGAAVSALPKEDVHTILFTDIEGSTTLTQRLGDARAQDLLRAHNIVVRDALKTHSGTEVKHTGDGIMASFPSASRALQCAIAVQQAVTAQAETPFRVRIGLNAGEPVAEEQDLFGTAVQLARRICDHADSGQILVSDVVRQLAMGKGFLFSDRGAVVLRGFEDPVRLYEVRWREDAAESP